MYSKLEQNMYLFHLISQYILLFFVNKWTHFNIFQIENKLLSGENDQRLI